MKSKNNILLLVTTLITVMTAQITHAAGGSGTGNGGDAVVCRGSAGNLLSADALDVYEAKVLRSIDLKATGASTLEDSFAVLINRLKTFSPERAKRYKDFANFFSQNSLMVDAQLTDIPDSQNVITPTGCKVEQLIIQKEPETQFDKRFLVQKTLWESLSIDHRAAMLMHEALLRESLQMIGKYNEVIQTRELRYVNSLVFGFEVGDYYHTLKESDFVSGFLSIPNFELVETKAFGELAGKGLWVDCTKCNSFSTIKGYDQDGFVNEVFLVLKGTQPTGIYEFGKLRFILTTQEKDQGFRVTRNPNGTMRISQFYLSEGLEKQFPIPAPQLNPDGFLEFKRHFDSAPVTTIDPQTLEVFALEGTKIGGVIDEKTCFSIGDFCAQISELELYAINFEKTDSGKQIRYLIPNTGEYQSAAGTLRTKSGLALNLLNDGTEHILKFDSQNRPLDGGRVTLTDPKSGLSVSGIYDPTKPADSNFQADPQSIYRYPEILVEVLPQSFPAQFSDLHLATAKSVRVKEVKQSIFFGIFRFRCTEIPAGTPFKLIPQPNDNDDGFEWKWSPAGAACKQ